MVETLKDLFKKDLKAIFGIKGAPGQRAKAAEISPGLESKIDSNSTK